MLVMGSERLMVSRVDLRNITASGLSRWAATLVALCMLLLDTGGGRAQDAASQPVRAHAAVIAGMTVAIFEPKAPGPYPLVLFSHGWSSCSTQSIYLTQGLAARGYVVMAPEHADSSCLGKPAPVRPVIPFHDAPLWSDATYRDRADDMIRLLAALKADPAWAARIDFAHVGLAGHSLGGYTALGLAGAWPSWRQPGIGAVLALSPYARPFIVKGALGSLKVPVMYQGGTSDGGITPYVTMRGGAFDKTSSPAVFVDLEGASHLAWTDGGRPYHALILDYAAAFLDRWLKGDRRELPAKGPGIAEIRIK
jgi:predicted dienelactone hydrolase